MCVTCYLSTDKKLTPISWQESNPGFNLELEDKIRPTGMTGKYVYYCGSWQGCGCGFREIGRITEQLLKQTRKELEEMDIHLRRYSELTSRQWWNNLTPPPKTLEELNDMELSLRRGWQDTAALNALVEDICADGYSCQVFICWAEDEEKTVDYQYYVNLDTDPLCFNFRTSDAQGQEQEEKLDYTRLYHISRPSRNFYKHC